MRTRPFRDQLQDLLERAAATLDGPNDCDPVIHDERFFARVLSQGSLGLGDSYVEGWWDCERIDELIHRIKRARLDRDVHARPSLPTLLRARWADLRSRQHAYRIGAFHYDLGNDLFEAMLDRRMIYTGALWDRAHDLDTAQEHKLERVARKLQLRPGQRVLDIGCGWGGTARFLSERYGVSVVGITVSAEQQRHAEALCRGLPVEIRRQDYRDVHDRFDRILSLGMIEHVGHRRLPTYFDVVRRCLRSDGLFVLQSIGASDASGGSDPWIARHIFPESALPTAGKLAGGFEDRMVLEHWENFGADYDRTLMAWHTNFERAWPSLRARYGEPFRRKWRYYLLACAGAFRARSVQLWQLVFARDGVAGGYRMEPSSQLHPVVRRQAVAS